jgi:ribonuclease BN (tRNA processing enzyme)
LAYRFDTDEGSITFSGDTSPSENLIRLAQGTDVLVHEVMAREWAEQSYPEPRDAVQEGILQHLLSSHTTIEDVGLVAERAGAKTLVLNHLVPANWPEHLWRKARKGFSGKLIVGKDLARINVGTS